MAIGLGEYLSSKAHKKYILAERRREQWEYKNCRENEIRSLIALFRKKGMSESDAELVVNKMAQYENLFVNMMITEERGLLIPEDTEIELCTDAGVMFVSFATFGSIPLLVILACDFLGFARHWNYIIALCIAVAMLTIFGLIKSSMW